MAQPLVIEGTWDDLAARADELRRYGRLRLIVPATDDLGAPESATPRAIEFGMFAELGDLTDDDFRAAEWRGEDLEA